MSVVGSPEKKISTQRTQKHVRAMHYGRVEIDPQFTIKRTLDRTFSLILSENSPAGKNFLQLLKTRVSPADYLSIGKKLLDTAHENVRYHDAEKKSPLNCIRIQLYKDGDKPSLRYIRIVMKKSASFYRDGSWIIVVQDISKAVRDFKKKQESLKKPQKPKARSTEREIFNLIQHNRSVVSVFLKDTIASIKELVRHLSLSTPSIDNANDILCLIHQIKGDASVLNFQNIAVQAHAFESILANVNNDPQNCEVYFKQLPKAVPSLVKSVNRTQYLYKKLVEGGWQTKENKGSHKVLAQKLEVLIEKLAEANNKRVILVNDGYLDSAIPKHYQNTINTVVTQLARNAIVHGIEDSTTRINCSKTPYGCLHLSVTTTAQSFILNVRDDGRGLNAIKIKEAALNCGLFDNSKVNNWSKPQILNALFTPGFSTAAKVNHHAGRGIGLNIIKKHVEHHGGSISIRSILGQFTEFSITLPLQKKK